jgi:hypothetical protein
VARMETWLGVEACKDEEDVEAKSYGDQGEVLAELS